MSAVDPIEDHRGGDAGTDAIIHATAHGDCVINDLIAFNQCLLGPPRFAVSDEEAERRSCFWSQPFVETVSPDEQHVTVGSGASQLFGGAVFNRDRHRGHCSWADEIGIGDQTFLEVDPPGIEELGEAERLLFDATIHEAWTDLNEP
jgi:hypothetical protein